MIAAIHQSQYLPWPPYFKKLAQADAFVWMDTVQFQKNGVQNRNRIRNAKEAFWLTVPVTGHLEDPIRDKKIADDRWRSKHAKSIEGSYRNAPLWGEHGEGLLKLFENRFETLGEANEMLFLYLVDRLGISTRIVRLSELRASGSKSDLVLNICKELGCRSYLSGMGGKSYLQGADFEREGIEIVYSSFAPPQYPQFQGEFLPELSMIDMLFNVPVAEIREWLKASEGAPVR